MTLRRLSLFSVVLLAAGVGYWGWEEWQLRQPGFHEQDCWFEQTITGPVHCGLFTVRENRQKPDSRTIQLPVVIFGTERPQPDKEPILYLTGGPGAPADLGEQCRVNHWWAMRRSFPAGHDLIVMGQRGTGLEEPDFECRELSELEVPPEAPSDNIRSLQIDAAARCADRLRNDGVDLAAYNSRESAADIAELRSALGIESWTLFGRSYGTRLALSALRYHPKGIRAVILDSVVPPQADWLTQLAADFRSALEKVFADCAADDGCAQQYGDLATAYEKAIERLSAPPTKTFSVRELLGHGERTYRIGGRWLRFSPASLSEVEDLEIPFDAETLNDMLFAALSDEEARSLIPVLLREIAAFRSSAMRAQFRDYLLRQAEESDIVWAIYLSHVCHDEMPFISKSRITAAAKAAGSLAYLVTDAWPSYLCEFWPVGEIDPIENTPVESAIPALLLAGRYDPITPYPLALAAARHLPNGYAYELADAGHGVLVQSDCARRLTDAFLRSLERPPEDTCGPQALTARFYRQPLENRGQIGPETGSESR